MGLGLNMSAAFLECAMRIDEQKRINAFQKLGEVEDRRKELDDITALLGVIEARINQDSVDLYDQKELIEKVRELLGDTGSTIFPEERTSWSKEEAEKLVSTLNHRIQQIELGISPITMEASQEMEEAKQMVEMATQAIQRENRSKEKMIERAGRV